MRSTSDLIDSHSNGDPGRAGEAASSDASRLNKHRGLWSFLTRAFVLGQIIVAEQFLGAGARAAEGNESDGPANGHSMSDAGGASGAAGAVQAVGAAEGGGVAAPTNTIQANTLAGSLPQMSGQDLPGTGEPVPDGTVDAGGAQAAAVAADSAGAEDASVLVPGDGPSGPGVLPGIDTGIGETVGTTLETVVTLVDTVADTLFGTLDGVVSSLPIVGDTLGSLTGTLHNAVSGVTDTLSGVAKAFPALGDVGSGVISFASGTASDILNPDALFDGGRYTDLNITLQSGLGAPVGGAVATVGSVADTLFGGVPDLTAGDLGLQDGPAFGLVSNLLNDPLKGGLGELFT